LLSEKRALAIGLFDGVHRGHKAVLRETVKTANESGFIPGASTFSGITMTAKNVQNRLLLSGRERVKRIKAAGIEYIQEFDFADICDMTPYEFIYVLANHFSAGAVIVGEDFRFGKGQTGDTELLKQLCRDFGLKLKILPELTDDEGKISSGRIRNLLENGETEAANALLGYSFYYKMPVVMGRQLGRRLGFPTINQIMPQSLVKVKFGVYLSEILIDGKIYKGITNIGVKPTVHYPGLPLLETYIDGFNGDLYGKTERVHLLRFIRPEQHFDSIKVLKQQMESDREQLYL
jgi:riboflavin kinase/FMN adenylyltransferase